MIACGNGDSNRADLFADERASKRYTCACGLAGEGGGNYPGAQGTELLAGGFAEGFGDGNAGNVDAGHAVLVFDIEIDGEEVAVGDDRVDGDPKAFAAEGGNAENWRPGWYRVAADLDIPDELEAELAAADKDGFFGDNGFNPGRVEAPDGVLFIREGQDGEGRAGYGCRRMVDDRSSGGIGLRALQGQELFDYAVDLVQFGFAAFVMLQKSNRLLVPTDVRVPGGRRWM